MKLSGFFFGCLSGILVFGALLGLWDIARHQVELTTGYYDLPFKIQVPWYLAGDLFIAVGLFGFWVMLIYFELVNRRDKHD
jgi:hypothetical protein